MITREDIIRLAKSRGIKPRQEYVDALMAGIEDLRSAGILETPHRVSHFMAQVAHETGGFTILRESLTYTTAARLRAVWPARFRSKSNGELRHLIRNPVGLGDAVYGERMGNNKAGDGYKFRGAGWIQTTGREAFESYAAKLDLPTDDGSLDKYADDLGILLKFACLEWQEARCNEWADENDIVKVSKAINTGSATSGIRPVGMDDRRAWFAKAWSIWGERGTPDEPAPKPPSMATTTTVVTGATTGGVITMELVKAGLTDATQIKSSLKDLSPLPPITSAIWPAGAAAILIVVVLWILNRRSINV